MLFKLGAYAANPEDRRHDVRPLVGYAPPAWRLRNGNWRAVFEIKPDEVHVLRVLHRREVYR